MRETSRHQIDRLATFITSHIPGDPSQSQGAVDTAIRLLGTHVEVMGRIADLRDSLDIWKGQPDLWERLENWFSNLERELSS